MSRSGQLLTRVSKVFFNLSQSNTNDTIQKIEEDMGRKRVKGKRWGSRIIDLDILFYDNETIEKRNLKIPHPRLPQRRFVLVPLSELAPQLIHPSLNLSVSELLATTKDRKKIHMMGASD